MPLIHEQYEQMSGFKRSHVFGLKEAGWYYRRIAWHLSRRDATIRRCWQDWVNHPQRQEGSSRPRNMTERED